MKYYTNINGHNTTKLTFPEKVGHGKFDSEIAELFISYNLDLLDFVSGPFRGQRSVFACLAYHLSLDWKDTDILKELYNILIYNKRSIRDRIAKQQEELNLSTTKGKLPKVEFCGFFDEDDESGKIKDSNTLSSDNHLNHPAVQKSNKNINLNTEDKKMSTTKEMNKNTISREIKRNSVPNEVKKNSISEDKKRTYIQKDMKRNSISKDKKRTSIQKDMERNSISEDKKRTSIQSDMKRNSISEDKKRTSIQKDMKRNSISEDKNRTSIQKDMERNSISEDKKRTSIQKDMKRNSISEDKKRTSIQKDMERNSISEDKKRTSIQKDMKRNSISKEIKKSSILEEVKRNSIPKEMKRNSISDKIKTNSLSKEVKRNSTVVNKSDLSKSFVEKSNNDQNLSAPSKKDLGGDILPNIIITNDYANDTQASNLLKTDYAKDIDKIKQFIKTHCTNDQANHNVESANKVLASTNIKYQIEPNRSYEKKKEIIDHTIILAKDIIKTSQELITKAKNTIHRIREIRKGQMLKI